MAASADERQKGTAVTESESQAAAPAPPKEGGLHGWLQVVGTLFILFNIWYCTHTRYRNHLS
jgi:hypothetical protein